MRHNLWSALADSDLSILGNGSHTFCGNAFLGLFTIDLIICHSSLINKLSRKVLQDPCGSDHYPILIESNYSSESQVKYIRVPRLYSKDRITLATLYRGCDCVCDCDSASANQKTTACDCDRRLPFGLSSIFESRIAVAANNIVRSHGT